MRAKPQRVYDPPEPGDGTRIRADRFRPRGIAKAKAGIGPWLREIAPSEALRKPFHGKPVRSS